jgi:outer membrane lipoprotein-sorting protein
MLRNVILPGVLLSLVVPLASGANVPAVPSGMSAAQVVERSVEARGGLQAWRAVQTMSYSGLLDAGGKKSAQLPFLLELKRSHKSRFELEFENDKALQVYDGVHGWKLRPYLNRRDVEPFTPDELRSASMEADLDGPLVDYAAKGSRVDLEGTDRVEGRDAYRLKVTVKGGETRHIWVDAQTFLETKIEGIPRRMDGKIRAVEVYYRDYRNVGGLMVPYVLETAVQGVRQSHKMTIESVQVNPKLDDSLFTAPKSTPPASPAPASPAPKNG